MPVKHFLRTQAAVLQEGAAILSTGAAKTDTEYFLHSRDSDEQLTEVAVTHRPCGRSQEGAPQ